ncbi:MAG: 16S rRNA (guanine(527)-N(7))-methyltransferase RsmG [Nitrospiraceae bacterium]
MFHVEHFGEIVSACLADHVHLIGLTLTQTQLDQFATFADQLSCWNEKINLTAITESKDVAIKHFFDSLYGVNALRTPRTRRMVDVGSGGGFPGIPLKIVLPELPLTMVEPSGKKVAFLLHMAGLLKLSQVHVLNRQIEHISRQDRGMDGPISFVVRGLKIEGRLRHLSSLLNSGDRLIVYGTDPWLPHFVDPHLVLVDEIPYQLPLDLGKRRLIVLERNARP